MFRLCDKEMYTGMEKSSQNLTIDRGMALHKMLRLITMTLGGEGYLTFMGNEFGHPEWIDFPREGNQWSYHYARRQWSLAKDPDLRFGELQAFDRAMLTLLRSTPHFYRYTPCCIWSDNGAKILVLRRGNLFFCFNFHPTNSVSDYAIHVPKGQYKTVLDSDAAEFGGFSLVDDSIIHRAFTSNKQTMIRLYLPSRTVIVLRREV
jgi:1,4-alpha-glucan branching enzyme